MALWGGRFSDAPTDAVFALSRSVHFDWRLAPYDLRSSLSHLKVLRASALLQEGVAQEIERALRELITEVASGKFSPIGSDEDVHSALERGLTEKIGATGGSLRAGRSRNDQVATDLKLFTIDHMLEVASSITQLNAALLAKASEYGDAPAPGFTHIQHAQPILFGHEIAKHVQSFTRDLERIQDWLKRTNVSPPPTRSGSRAQFPHAASQLASQQGAQSHPVGVADPRGNLIDAFGAGAQQMHGTLDAQVLEVRQG